MCITRSCNLGKIFHSLIFVLMFYRHSSYWINLKVLRIAIYHINCVHILKSDIVYRYYKFNLYKFIKLVCAGN